jgi:hypothetical protein
MGKDKSCPYINLLASHAIGNRSKWMVKAILAKPFKMG